MSYFFAIYVQNLTPKPTPILNLFAVPKKLDVPTPKNHIPSHSLLSHVFPYIYQPKSRVNWDEPVLNLFLVSHIWAVLTGRNRVIFSLRIERSIRSPNGLTTLTLIFSILYFNWSLPILNPTTRAKSQPSVLPPVSDTPRADKLQA